jgi:hypothetical protein
MFGLLALAVTKVLTSDEKLLVGSILALSEVSPIWPFTLSSAKNWVPNPSTLLQALDAPIQWMYWYVVVALTVQVPAQALERPAAAKMTKHHIKTLFLFKTVLQFKMWR